MVKQLKEILVHIAKLPKRDQRWILRKLPKERKIALAENQGLVYLKQAQRFRALNDVIPRLPEPDPLPTYCQDLIGKSYLYVAIIIEQGQYPWASSFLQKYDNNGLIQNAITNQVPDLKSLVKEALFHEWEESISFENYLETEHG